MGISKKGMQGFQFKEDGEQKDKRIVTYLTKLEHTRLKEYCLKNDTNISVFVRELILKQVI
jgi:hypothetical protein|tara:strand:+ start:1859 stop:2041 length:183 start_codon:yes stop_codon:yes gene_type:complete